MKKRTTRNGCTENGRGSAKRSLFRFALIDSVALLLFGGLLNCLLRCLLRCFFGCHSNYSPFRCDIEYCSLIPQLHEGIVLCKINVKKKITFLSFFYGRPIAIFPKGDSSVEGFPGRRREIARMKSSKSIPGHPQTLRKCWMEFVVRRWKLNESIARITAENRSSTLLSTHKQRLFLRLLFPGTASVRNEMEVPRDS